MADMLKIEMAIEDLLDALEGSQGIFFAGRRGEPENFWCVSVSKTDEAQVTDLRKRSHNE